MTRYNVILLTEAQKWLAQQPPACQQRIAMILGEYAKDPHHSGKQIQNPIWWHSKYGMPYRIAINSICPGLRCIYYAFDERGQMIIVKFGTHADNVYEDGN